MGAPEQIQHTPFDVEIEQALLGSLLVDNRRIDIAAADLESRHFYDPLHQRLFDMIVALSDDGDVTPLTLNAILKTDAGLAELGGTAYLAGLARAAPSAPPIAEFCKILKDLSFRRDIVRIGEEMARAALDPPSEGPVQEIADIATEALLQAGLETAKPDLSPFEFGEETIREIEAYKAGKPIPLLKTGFDKLDREIGGMRGGDLITILGKSGMGKSALMGSVALNMARAGIPVIFFSLEMGGRQIVERLVCDWDFDLRETDVPPMWYSRLRNMRVSENEFERFILTNRRLKDIPLKIVEDDGLTMAQIATRARAFQAKHKGRTICVLIDYLQIVEPSNNRDNRERQVASIARGAKSLAKRLKAVVIAGSQMNENDEGRAKEARRPRASDARESKVIMNESDLMLSPYRPAVAVENERPLEVVPGDPEYIVWAGKLKEVRHRFELLGLKNRHGRRFDLELWAEMGSSAIRDHEPRRAMSVADQAGQDLLEGL